MGYETLNDEFSQPAERALIASINDASQLERKA